MENSISFVYVALSDSPDSTLYILMTIRSVREMDLETAADLFMRLQAQADGGLRVFLCGGPAEPVFLADMFKARPHLAANVTFIGAWLPGINLTDWTQFHPGSRAEATFLYDTHRAAYETGRLRLYPLHYSATADWLTEGRLDAALIPVTAPDARGRVSFSYASDFGPLLARRADIFKVAVIKPHMPAPQDAPSLPLSAFQSVIEDPTPLLHFDKVSISETSAAIARHIAGELSDGDTVQSGIGTIQQIAMAAMSHHKNMRVHTGMVSNALLDALPTGAISEAPGSIVTGTAAGAAALYDACAEDDRLAFKSVRYTHAIDQIARIPRFTAINGAIEVDLFGQVNSEWVGGVQVSATGGVADFVRGCKVSEKGRSIIALPATTRKGQVSRIVPSAVLSDSDLAARRCGYGRNRIWGGAPEIPVSVRTGGRPDRDCGASASRRIAGGVGGRAGPDPCLGDAGCFPGFLGPAAMLPEPLAGMLPDLVFEKSVDAVHAGLDICFQITCILRHKGRVKLDPESRRARADRHHRDDRHLVFQRQTGWPRSGHRIMPEQGRGYSFTEFLIIHESDRFALGQAAHQFAGADAFGRIDAGAVSVAQLVDTLVNVWIVERAIRHHRIGNALCDRGGHDLPIRKMT